MKTKQPKTVKDCIAAIKKLPGISCEPKLSQQSEYVDTVQHKHTGTTKAIVFRQMYRVAVESYWRFDLKGHGSWIRLETGMQEVFGS